MNKADINKIKWGDIFYCNLPAGVGSVQGNRRPVLVIQNNRLNATSPTVVVAVITSVRKRMSMPTHIEIGKECGLKEPSMVMLEQIRTVDKLEELEEYVGTVTDDTKIIEIQRGIKASLGIPMKPKSRRTGTVLSLCPQCRQEFMNVPENIVKRVDPLQSEKEPCDKCQVRYGYDYLIMKKYNHNSQGRDN